MVRRIARVVKWLVSVTLLGVVVLGVATSLGRYLARAAFEEGRILFRRRPIASLVADTAVPSAQRARLNLVLEARAFAESTLALRAGESFTQFSALDRDTLVLVVSAARRDTLAAKTWWFPIVGRFPYKGFFSFAQAEHTAAQLRAEGYATYVRPAAAFSTLGWFNDPVISTTLRLDSAALANTVIHELTHNSVFVKNQVVFNESLASFVGARGAEEFFRARGDSHNVARVRADWEDDKLLGAFWAITADRVEAALSQPGDSAARVARADSVYAAMRATLLREVAPRLTTIDPRRLERIQLDNAALLARRTYARDLALFDSLYVRSGGSVRESVGRVRASLVGGGDPFQALRALVGPAEASAR